jgi:ZIP family zinc transporter
MILSMPCGIKPPGGSTIDRNMSTGKKGFLNAFAVGILIFLIIDVLSHAWDSVSFAATGGLNGQSSFTNAILDLIGMFGGIAFGLLWLTLYGTLYMKESQPRPPML